jgi:hypothetical protein
MIKKILIIIVFLNFLSPLAAVADECTAGDCVNSKGTIIYPDGRKYVGEFQYGERNGQGILTYPDGRRYTGEFKDGEKNGQGTLVYPDGKKLEGTFKNGEFVGK